MEVSFRLWLRECHSLTGTPSAFVDKGSIMKHTTLQSLIRVERNGSGVEVRTLDYENPSSNPGCGVKTLGKFKKKQRSQEVREQSSTSQFSTPT